MSLMTAALLAFFIEAGVLTILVAIYELRNFFRKHKERV